MKSTNDPHSFKFSVGPWNISEGFDPYGPGTRPIQSFEWKLAAFKGAGFDAIMFHDDDVVPGIETKSPAIIRKEAAQMRDLLKNHGMVPEIVAPRLWFDARTVDGAYTSNDPKCRQYAMDRSLQTIEIARILGCDLIVLWLAREGTYIRESKDPKRSMEHLIDALNRMLAFDKGIRIAIEPKPNEPMDHAYLPTIGHALAAAQLTQDPSRVGGLIETAHCILAGLDPSDEMGFALSCNKLWSVHLNDQNGLKFDQDKPFGSVNLRSAFNQVRVLDRHGYGKNGEYVAFDVHLFRTSTLEHAAAHLANSKKTFLRLLEKSRSFDERAADALIAQKNYQALDQMVIDHLLG